MPTQPQADGRTIQRDLRAAARIHVIGPPGSGKTWLAGRLAAARGWPVYHLDEAAHTAGGGSPLRAREELDALIGDLETREAWVCEGVDIGWIEPILARADLVIWLDEPWWHQAGRMGRRFVSGAVAEVRRQSGWRRFGRVRDYARQLGRLGREVVRSRSYGGGQGSPTVLTREGVLAALEPHAGKVLRVRGPGALSRLLERAGVSDPPPPGQDPDRTTAPRGPDPGDRPAA